MLYSTKNIAFAKFANSKYICFTRENAGTFASISPQMGKLFPRVICTLQGDIYFTWLSIFMTESNNADELKIA